MKISLNWLHEYIDIQESHEALADILTQLGLEVVGTEFYESVKGGLEGLVIGEVLTCEPHPNADRLKKTTVDIGKGNIVPIVCGAPNVAAGQKVVIAKVGTTLYPIHGAPFKIKKAKIRGEVSEGMICAEDEIGVGTGHDGIIVLETALEPGEPASVYFDIQTDHIIEIDLTPNRIDAGSHIGVARDLKAKLQREIQWPSVDDFKIDNHDYVIDVVVENEEACPRYSGITISNAKISASPDWLKLRLQSIGLSPINNVVDVTNFVLHELGQPLHAFDADKIEGKKVVVKSLSEGTKFTTLDGKERVLQQDDLMICDSKEAMCMAGVLGGLTSSVTHETRNIFIESAYFSETYIRKTAHYHGIKTDASYRYERGTDPAVTIFALQRAALLIKQFTGGSISSEIVDVYPEEIKDFKVSVQYRNVNRLIGKRLKKKRIREILNLLDIQIEKEAKDSFVALVPPYRVDVRREADIIEEIARVYGFDNIEISDVLGSEFLAEFPRVDIHDLQAKLTELLVANGFYEIITNSLTKPYYVAHTKSFKPEENVQILNQLSEELGVLRQSLVFSGLEVIAHNGNRREKNLKLFEFGKTYTLRDKTYIERNNLVIFMTGNEKTESWFQKTTKVQFHNISAIVHKVLARVGLDTKMSHDMIEDDIFSYGLSIKYNSRELVRLGRLHTQLTNLNNISEEVFYAVFDWDYLCNVRNESINFKGLSKFPQVRRDLSLVIDRHVSFEDIRRVANVEKDDLIRKVNVFDVYEGKNIGNDKKAYALSFILQDDNKTLTDNMIDRKMNKLINLFEKELDAQIRR